jgi:hypothetical protein
MRVDTIPTQFEGSVALPRGHLRQGAVNGTYKSLASRQRRSSFVVFFQKVFRPVGANRSDQIKDSQPEQSKPLNLMPLASRVILAFLKMPPSQTEDQIIRALLLHPGSDTKTLSKACGWISPIWHTHFGLMCQKRIEWLLPSDLIDPSETQFIHGILAEYSASNGSFKMKEEAEEGFRRLGIH